MRDILVTSRSVRGAYRYQNLLAAVWIPELDSAFQLSICPAQYLVGSVNSRSPLL